MDILLGYSGMALAFVIIAAIHLYFIIYSKANIVVKAVVIPIVLWYSLVLFYTPSKLMGWPTSQSIPKNSRVLSMMIREPLRGNPGAIYILTINYSDVEKLSLIRFNNP